MSAFAGVTFSQQHLSPADDANARRAMLPDCILRGCYLSAADYQLTMDPGYLMICGRQIRHSSAQTWTFWPGPGVARLSINISIVWSRGKETGYTISPVIDCADTVPQLPALVQEDINNGESLYQALICEILLGDDGIIGFGDQIVTLEG